LPILGDIFMKKLITVGNFLLLTLVLRAQQDYFLFIQSENSQPYYVQTNGKTLSSSAIGHLIIPGLKDSIYTLSIGFPKNQFPEQVFQVRINRKDAGYQLKNLGAEGWALFNMQTLQLIKAQPTDSKKQTLSYGDVKKSDVFSILMAGLVNDSAVLYTSIAKADPVRTNSTTSFPDTQVSQSEEVVKKEAAATNEIAKPEVEPPKSDITTVKPTAVKQPDSPRKDSLIAKPGPVKQEDTAKKDTLAATAVVIAQPSADPTVINDQKTVSDSADSQKISMEPKRAETKPAELKPLIIWFSETKNALGTELTYFDMSSAEKTDTIKILILKEDQNLNKEQQSVDVENSKPVKKPVEVEPNEEKKSDDQKTGAGKLFGKIFGKKDNSTSTGNETASTQKTSTIKVTTVPDKNSVDSAAGQKNSDPTSEATSKKAPETTKTNEKKEGDQKTGGGGFLGKIFGKDDKKKPPTNSTGSIEVTSTVNVEPVDDTKSVDSNTVQKNNNKKAEVVNTDEKKNADQKTGAGKLLERLFGKKDTTVNNSSGKKTEPVANQSTITVTTIDSGKSTVSSPPANTESKNTPVNTNSDCRQFASDFDVDKLRVRILEEKDIDGQVTEARKFFKTKCITTKQIKGLSELFRTDEGKYKLFDAAYPFVSDTGNFKSLIELLSDEYYINRFKAMVRM
jgi:branched-subunit amino acid transport protein AzlD